MDINRLYRSAERACGRVLDILPEEKIGSIRKYLSEILEDETLPSLDIIYPRLLKRTFNTSELIPLSRADITTVVPRAIYDNRYLGYRIPFDITDGLQIMSIKNLVPTTTFNLDSNVVPTHGPGGVLIGASWNVTGPNKWGRYSSANMYEVAVQGISNYADNLLAGQFTQSFRYYFYPPNILMLPVSADRNLTLSGTFCVKNDPNLISINDTAWEGIKNLFILDVKKTIWNQFGIYSQINTPNGEIDLKIDDWSNAENERKELYEQYLSTAHLRTSAMRTG